jgi:hypothetical protein
MVMATAQGDQVGKIGLSPERPRNDVVYLREVDEGAARESAAFVSTGNLNPLGRGGTSAHTLLVKDGAVGALK